MADVGTQHDVILVLKDGGGEARPNHQPVIWNVDRVTWIIIIPSNLLQIHDLQEPPENDVVELQARRRRGRQLIGQGDRDPHVLPIPRLAEDLCDLML